MQPRRLPGTVERWCCWCGGGARPLASSTTELTPAERRPAQPRHRLRRGAPVDATTDGTAVPPSPQPRQRPPRLHYLDYRSSRCFGAGIMSAVLRKTHGAAGDVCVCARTVAGPAMSCLNSASVLFCCC